MKKSKLSQQHRLLVALLYIMTIIISYSVLGGKLADILRQTEHASVWFFSGILLVIMGKYVTEPYFNSPTDTLSNSISLFLFLLTVSDRDELYGFYFLVIYSGIMFVISIIHIVLKTKNSKIKALSFWVLSKFGSSKCMFSIVYLLAAYSYFQNNLPMLIVAITLWICLTFFDVYELALSGILSLLRIVTSKKNESIGIAVKNNSDSIFHVEVSKSETIGEKLYNGRNDIFAIKIANDLFELAIGVDSKMLLDSVWIEMLLLTENGKYVSLTMKEIEAIGITVDKGCLIGTTYLVDVHNIELSWQKRINEMIEVKRKYDFVGFVLPDSNINIIRFSICRSEDNKISEGTIVETRVNDKNILYQVINGVTKEENNTSSSADGYMCAIARKLGTYDADNNELIAAKWTPRTSEPVFICNTKESTDFQGMANTSIGHLPMSEMIIPLKDINAIVTHNTAILGILGVGKSCLTFELIKKIVADNIKVVCIDITNQYGSPQGLQQYIDKAMIQDELMDKDLQFLEALSQKTGTYDSADSWGNVSEYRQKIETYINGFLTCSNINVLILNPDRHVVRKAATSYKIVETVELSVVEKTRIISEALLKCCMGLGQTDQARCCIVYEEAHSLTPEWNSVVNNGDERHSNGTAKVILQGRKYGLGCILVTQRTANVTKSILNQCNTIFALRVFDDTGKSFLENYIGKDYSDVLPTLEERHAIVIGKGLKLKQPVIVQLNDAKYVKMQTQEDN